MGKSIRELLGDLWSVVVDGLIDLVYGLLCLVQFLFCCSLGYYWIFQPMASTPGARDGTGLLFVMLFILVGAVIVSIGLSVPTRRLLKSIFPRWETWLF